MTENLFNVVLVEPEIPQNTGNIGRTCVATKSSLHLVHPMGFVINDKNVKRAGLDYWPHLSWFEYSNFDQLLTKIQNPKRVFYFSTKAQQSYTDVTYQKGDWLVFGKETKGLSPDLLQCNEDQLVKIPLLGPARSLNLATAVAIACYEGVRQLQNPRV